jgi:hypothetical protein
MDYKKLFGKFAQDFKARKKGLLQENLFTEGFSEEVIQEYLSSEFKFGFELEGFIRRGGEYDNEGADYDTNNYSEEGWDDFAEAHRSEAEEIFEDDCLDMSDFVDEYKEEMEQFAKTPIGLFRVSEYDSDISQTRFEFIGMADGKINEAKYEQEDLFDFWEWFRENGKYENIGDAISPEGEVWGKEASLEMGRTVFRAAISDTTMTFAQENDLFHNEDGWWIGIGGKDELAEGDDRSVYMVTYEEANFFEGGDVNKGEVFWDHLKEVLDEKIREKYWESEHEILDGILSSDHSGEWMRRIYPVDRENREGDPDPEGEHVAEKLVDELELMFGGEAELQSDSSLHPSGPYDYPFEIASPVIQFSPKNLSELTKWLSDIQEEHGFYVNDSCGFHTHFSWPHRNPMDQFWVICNIAVDDEFQKDMFTLGDGTELYDSKWAPKGFIWQIGQIISKGGDMEDIMDLFSGAKYRVLGVHLAHNTMEWRGPRGFIKPQSVTQIREYISLVYKMVSKIGEYLRRDSIGNIKKEDFYAAAQEKASRFSSEYQPNKKDRAWKKKDYDQRKRYAQWMEKLAEVAKNAEDQETIAKLAKHGDGRVYVGLAANPNIKEELVYSIIKKMTAGERFLSGSIDKVSAALLMNNSTPEHFFAELFSKAKWIMNEEQEVKLASNPKTPEEVLAEMANNPHIRVARRARAIARKRIGMDPEQPEQQEKRSPILAPMPTATVGDAQPAFSPIRESLLRGMEQWEK